MKGNNRDMKRMWSEEEISSQKKDIATLVDSKGNPRFIEGEGTTDEITGFTPSYCKWSLSGTHLMLVLAGTIANGITISTGSIATYEIPEFIMNKIYPVWAGRFLETKTMTLVADDFSAQTLSALLKKPQEKATPITMRRLFTRVTVPLALPLLLKP